MSKKQSKKSETKKPAEREMLKKHVELLPVTLSSDEYAARAHRLAEMESEIASEEDRHAQIKSELKSNIARLISERSRLAIIVSQKAEPRNVECATYHVTGSHSAEIVRLDMNQTVRTREMTKEELQMVFPLETGDENSGDAGE